MITTSAIYQDAKAIIKLALEDRVVRGANNDPAYKVVEGHRNHVAMYGSPELYYYDIQIDESQFKSFGSFQIEIPFIVGLKTAIRDEFFNSQISNLLNTFSKQSWNIIPYNFTYNSTTVTKLPDIGIIDAFRGSSQEFPDYGESGTATYYIFQMQASFTFSFTHKI